MNHQHPVLDGAAFLWAMFFVTQLFYWFSKAVLTKRSATNQAIKSVWSWFAWQWPILGLRFMLATAVFFWWFNNPDLVDKFFDSVGTHLAEGWMRTFIESVSFPLNPGTAIIYSIASDSILDKVIALLSKFVPKLQRALPSVEEGEKDAGG